MPHTILFYSVVEKTYNTNNAINFFLYIMSGQRFRTDLVKLFRCNGNKPPLDGSASVTLSTVTSSVPLKIDANKVLSS